MNRYITNKQFQITFPGGELIYNPINGNIFDVKKNKTISLPAKRRFSLLHDMTENESSQVCQFKPICLTIYANHRCNLNCTYCYVPQKDKYPEDSLDPIIVKQGAQMVAKNCKEKNIPFTIGFHGGNEPLLNTERLQAYLDICRSVAQKNNVDFQAHCTTNGVIPEDKAHWAAKNFHGITLSWDGMPEIHDTYRKDMNGHLTGEMVSRNAIIFSKAKKNNGLFMVRSTVTALSVNKLLDITRYFEMHGVRFIEFYPVFRNKSESFPEEVMPDSQSFVFNLIKSRAYGKKHGLKILFSGTRIIDHHSRYCMLLQDNLTITPDGYLTNCYHYTQNYSNENNLFLYGRYDETSKNIFIDRKKIQHILQKYQHEPEECTKCFNQFHCSHGCPEVCPIEQDYNPQKQFDCLKERWIGLASILQRAGYLKQFENEKEFINFFRKIEHRKL